MRILHLSLAYAIHLMAVVCHANAFDFLRMLGFRNARNSVCYDELGCFDVGRGSLFSHHAELPQAPEAVKPDYFFYRPQDNNETYQYIDYFDLQNSVVKLQLDPSKQLFVIIHGFKTRWPKKWMFDMLEALQAQGHNVIITRWTKGSAGPNYYQAAANTRIIGAMTARVLLALVNNFKASLSTTTIIGFSLGAHVAGFTGERLTDLYRIIGLDPAGPVFNDAHRTARLDETDAELVVAFHTNGQKIGQGIRHSVGMVDFWPNGGKLQPGCPAISQAFYKLLGSFDFNSLSKDVRCHHKIAPQILLDAIRNEGIDGGCNMLAFPCDRQELDSCLPTCNTAGGCAIAGLKLNRASPFRGDYYFYTRPGYKSHVEFCGSQYSVHLIPYTGAKGAVRLSFTFSDGSREQMNFTTGNSELPPSQTLSKVYVSEWGKEITSVTVMYYKSDGLLSESGPEFWYLRNIWLEAFEGFGLTSTINANIEVRNEIPVDLPLQRFTLFKP